MASLIPNPNSNPKQVFLRNGAAMVVMRTANAKLVEWDLKD